MANRLTLLLLLVSLTAISQPNTYNEVNLAQLMQKVKTSNYAANPSSSNILVLDVRTPGEYMDTVPGGRHIGIGRIKGAMNISLQDLINKPDAIKQLDNYKDKEVYVICSHSYRSRRISNLLLENGFKKVNNVQGGMTEWYRNHDLMKSYLGGFENNISYHNMSPAELFHKMNAKEPVVMIGFNSPPRFFFDSLVAPLYPVFPDFHNVTYYRPADSLKVLEQAKAANGKAIVLFSAIGGGSTDAAEWLVKKGIPNVHNLIGNLPGFFEYLENFQGQKVAISMLKPQSAIRFYTPLSFCRQVPRNMQWVDLRHDTTFNKITKGTRLDYKTLKGAVNFPFYKTADGFEQQFPDKNKLYVVIPENGYTGVELVTALINKGYRFGWLLSGIERWEWYTNNIPEFGCKDQFIQ
jgi:rhodanese-related sulfurtransferase